MPLYKDWSACGKRSRDQKGLNMHTWGREQPGGWWGRQALGHGTLEPMLSTLCSIHWHQRSREGGEEVRVIVSLFKKIKNIMVFRS